MKIVGAVAERIEHVRRHDDGRGEGNEPASREHGAIETREIVA